MFVRPIGRFLAGFFVGFIHQICPLKSDVPFKSIVVFETVFVVRRFLGMA